MTDNLIARAEAVLEGVTDGPWETYADPCHYDTVSDVRGGSAVAKGGLGRELMVSVGGYAVWQTQEANTRFIAAARQLVPDLTTELRKVTAELQSAMGQFDLKCQEANREKARAEAAEAQLQAVCQREAECIARADAKLEAAKCFSAQEEIDAAWDAFGTSGNRNVLSLAEQIASHQREVDDARAELDAARGRVKRPRFIETRYGDAASWGHKSDYGNYIYGIDFAGKAYSHTPNAKETDHADIESAEAFVVAEYRATIHARILAALEPDPAVVRMREALNSIAAMETPVVLPWTHEQAADSYWRMIDTMKHRARTALQGE